MSESLLPRPTKGEVMKTSGALWECTVPETPNINLSALAGCGGAAAESRRQSEALVQTTSPSSRPLLEPHPQDGLFWAPLTIRIGSRFFQFVKSGTTHPSASLVPRRSCDRLIHFSLFLWVFALKSFDGHFGGIPRRNTGNVA